MSRILIVDDDPAIRRIVQKSLVTLGFEVAGLAADGAEAFACARLLRPDLVLMDIVMPGPLDGVDAAKKIRAELDIPVVFLTGHADDKTLTRAKCADPFGFIVKPFQEEELKAVIDLALHKKGQERHLRRSLGLFRELTEATPFAFRLCSGDLGRLLYASPACETLWGLPLETLRQDPLAFATTALPEDRPDLQAALERQRRGEATETYCRRLGHDGTLRWLRDSAFPIRTEDGAVHHIAAITEDVTERRRQEEALRVSEERYRIVADRTHDWEFWLDPAGRFRYVSPSCERITGHPAETFLADPDLLDRIVHPGDRAAFADHRCVVADRRVPGKITFRIHRTDGQTRWIHHVCAPVFDGQGRFLGIRGSNRDVTDHRQSEAIIHAQRDLGLALAEVPTQAEALALCLDAALAMTGFEAGGIYLFDAQDGALRLAIARGLSEAFTRAVDRYGADSDRARLVREGRPLYHGIHDDAFARNEDLRREGLRFVAVVPIPGDGQVAGSLHLASRTHETLAEPQRRAVETTAGRIGVLVKRFQAEAALRERLAELNAIYENAPLTIVLLDRERRVRKANARALRVAGADEASLIGRRGGEAFRCLNALDDPAGCGFGLRCRDCAIRQAVLDTFAAGRGVRQVEAQLPVPRDGRRQVLSLLVDTAPLEVAGEPLVLVTLQDVTERKALEAQLFEAQKMEAVGTLAGGIAHDFNNILGAILGFAEMAGEETDPATRSHYVQQILQAAGRARNLTGQILAFGRRSLQDKHPVDLRTLVREGLQMLRQTIPASVEIRTALPDHPCTVSADPTQMHQVLMNLCTNAAQAMGEGGGILSVTLERDASPPPGAAAPAGPPPEALVRLTVADDGPGIDADLLERIFEPFFTTKKAGEGTGLGLSVVYGIVKNHGGEITVASRPGEGAAFTVRLPAAPEEKTATDAPLTAEPPPRGRERILLVDDEPAMVELGRRMLTALGYEVTACAESHTALEAFVENPDAFDLLLTDMTMPRMTGRELARRILALRPGTPVILCTGYNEHVTEAQALQSGIRAFLLKPFTRQELARVLRQVLDTPAPPPAV